MDQLIIRNIQLEAELQLAKTRAAQAETSVLWLAKRSESKSLGLTTTDGSICQLEFDVGTLKGELARIKQELSQLHTSFAIERTSGAPPGHMPDLLEHSIAQSSSRPQSIDAVKQSFTSSNSFDINRSVELDIRAGHIRPLKPFRQGEFNDEVDDLTEHSALACNSAAVQRVNTPNRTRSHGSSELSRPCKPEAVESRANALAYVPAKAHNNLAGSATYIEDMDEVEKEAFWQNQAQRYSIKASADDWRVYYETTIRPSYLARMSKGTRGTKAEEEHKSEPTAHQGLDAMGGARETANEIAGAKSNSNSRLARLTDQPQPAAGLLGSRWAQHTNGSLSSAINALEEYAEHASKNFAVIPDLALGRPEVVCGHANNICRADRSTQSTNTEIFLDNPDIRCRPSSAQTSTVQSSELSDFSQAQHQRAPADLSGSPQPSLSLNEAEVKSTLSDSEPIQPSQRPPRNCTVVIGNIPALVKLAEVVSKIRGGKLRLATMIRTAGMKTTPYLDTNTIWVVFLEPKGAQYFADYCKSAPLTFTDRNNSVVQAQVTLLKTHTRRLETSVAQLVKGETQLTRVLSLDDASHRWTPEKVVEELTQYYNRAGFSMARDPARHGLKHVIPSPLTKGKTPGGLLYFEYASLREAKWVFDLIGTSMKQLFLGIKRGFLADPCDQPFKTNEIDLPQVESPLIQFANPCGDDDDDNVWESFLSENRSIAESNNGISNGERAHEIY